MIGVVTFTVAVFLFGFLAGIEFYAWQERRTARRRHGGVIDLRTYVRRRGL